MPLVHPCASKDCNTLTMGEFCVDCEERTGGGTEVDDLEQSLLHVVEQSAGSPGSSSFLTDAPPADMDRATG
jgi:hypothetical protein